MHRTLQQTVKVLVACFLAGQSTLLVAQTEDEKPIDVTFAEFGFDERAVPGTFNVLSIQIRNSSTEPYEGTLTLRRLLSATGAWTDVEQTQSLYLGPGSVKLVQFFPFVLDTSEEWEIRWGETLDDIYIVEQAALTSGARVLFNDPYRMSGVTSGLKGFREDYFPPTTIGTDGLALAVLDHMPDWEEPRRRAFRDWLYRGGVLHVLPGSDGHYPRLPVDELNHEPRPTRFGSGRVYWQNVVREELNADFVYQNIYPTVQREFSLARSGGDRGFVDPTTSEYIADLERYFSSYSDWNSDSLIPGRLKQLVRPQHNWVVIYAASGFYMLLLFPGGLLLARSKLDYRVGLVALVVVVAGFSWMFRQVGARGYGESTRTVTAAVARPLSGGRFDVELWSSVFVTEGGSYAITHAGEAGAYSTAQNIERIDGQASHGQRAALTSDMPQFTFRTFVNRMQANLGELQFEPLASVTQSSAANDLAVTVTGGPAGEVRSGVVMVGDQTYPLNLDLFRDGKGRLIAGEGQSLVDELQVTNKFRRFRNKDLADQDSALDRFRDWLMARDLGLRLIADAHHFRLPADLVRVYVLCDLPESLTTRDASDPETPLGSQSGRLLYSLDVILPKDRLAEANR
ncbi:MAG: hypothetical protein ACYTGL_18140 [Planctomycetota bacterium]|jgi:hypothetical protein